MPEGTAPPPAIANRRDYPLPDATDVSFSTTVLPGDTVNVHVNRPAGTFFAKIVGVCADRPRVARDEADERGAIARRRVRHDPSLAHP